MATVPVRYALNSPDMAQSRRSHRELSANACGLRSTTPPPCRHGHEHFARPACEGLEIHRFLDTNRAAFDAKYDCRGRHRNSYDYRAALGNRTEQRNIRCPQRDGGEPRVGRQRRRRARLARAAFGRHRRLSPVALRSRLTGLLPSCPPPTGAASVLRPPAAEPLQ